MMWSAGSLLPLLRAERLLEAGFGERKMLLARRGELVWVPWLAGSPFEQRPFLSYVATR